MIEARTTHAPVDLTSMLGESGVIPAGPACESYEIGARYDRGRARVVLRPSSTEQVVAALQACTLDGIEVIPQSGNTGVVAGSTPDASAAQAVLSMDRMRSTFELNRRNRTLRISAGFRLSEINKRLEDEGLFFPIDLGADPCVGGMVATNTGGARFLRYGDLRRNTLGLEVVTMEAEPRVLSLGHGLRKDNSVPDWKQLFIGTGGSFGVITEAVLNVEPLPRQNATAYVIPASEEAVFDILQQFEEHAGPYLTAFETMSGNAIRRTFEHAPSVRNPFPGGAVPEIVLLVELTRPWEIRVGEQSLDDVLESILEVLLTRDDPPVADAFVGHPSEMWALRHALSEGVKAAGKLIAFDLGFRRDDAMLFRKRMRDIMACEFPEVEICDFGHVGDGGLHYNLVVHEGPDGADEARLAALRDRVISVAVEDFAGSFSAEHGIGRKNQAYYDRYTPAGLRSLATAFKEATSPGPVGSTDYGSRSPQSSIQTIKEELA